LFTQIDEPFSDDFLLADLNIQYDFGEVLLTSITSYMDRDIQVIRDAGALTSSITGGSQGFGEEVYTLDSPLDDSTTLESLTQELRLSGVSGNFDWVAGFFYSDIKRHYSQFLNVAGYEDLTGIPTAGQFAPKDALFWSDLDYNKYQQTAVFGEVTWAVLDRFDLTGGLRWYDFEEERTQVFDGIFGAGADGNAVQTAGSTSSDGISPRLVASWAATENVQLNAQVAKGFRLGGINDSLNFSLCTPADLETFGGFDTWDDEVIWNYEIGAKSTIGNGRGILNVSLFYMDISDLQGTLTAGSCSSRIIFNIPEAKSVGIEFELAYQLTERFDFAISASHIESEITKTVSSIDSGGNPVDIGVEEGNPLPTVPENQAAIAANYVWPMDNAWEGYVTGTWQYVDSRFTQIGDQIPGFGTVDLHALGNDIGGPLTEDFFFFNPELPSYNIANLRLGFRNDKYDVSLYVNNVGDERAFLALDQERGSLGRVGFLTNQPRTYGVTARMNF
jgi:iron complex outermembrane receptor protein